MRRVAILMLAVLLLGACGQKSGTLQYAPEQAAGWPSFGGAPGGGHYSPAGQITPQNVQALARA